MSEDTPQGAYARNLRRLQTEGLDAATEAAIALLRDPNTPAAAKATTLNSMFRISGLFEAEDDPEKPQHEMTSEELNRALGRSRRRLDELKNGRADED